MEIDGTKILSLEISEEPHFSWRGCDNCGNRLGNNVYDCNAYFKEDYFEIALCEMCILAHEYGEELDSECMNKFEV